MNKVLEDAFRQARELPEDEQERIAKIVLDVLHDSEEDRRWDDLLESERSLAFLRTVEAEVEANMAAGRSKPIDCKDT